MTDGGLSQPVTALRGVGPQLAQRLARLGVERIADLLFVLPLRYEDRTRISPIGSLQPGMRAVVEGEIQLVETVLRRRRQLLLRVSDGTGSVLLRFFHFSGQQAAALRRGTRLRLYGELRRGSAGLEIVHPEYRSVRVDEPLVDDRLTPIYPLTEGVTQGRLRALVDEALRRLQLTPPEDLLGPLLEAGLPGLVEALMLLHRPPPDVALETLEAGRHPAQRRLALEELLAHHLSMRLRREAQRSGQATRLMPDGELVRRFLGALPFELTAAQRRVLDEIGRDLELTVPMLRLVQGDVGSGKTVVAAAAALAAIEAGRQAAIMAPTELLAEQHFRNFDQWLSALAVPIVWLTGSVKGRRRAKAEAMLASDTPVVAVGTHALFQEGVHFGALALVIVDEQHRFGVHQRLALREKGAVQHGHQPHQLIMTATPIPRTLAMTAYADLDTSVIDELPPGRTPVRTVVMPDSRRQDIVRRVHEACAAGRQAYWVCPLIDESDTLEAQAAAELHASLTQALPGLRIGLVHGRLRAAEKDAVMQRFKSGGFDLLVATTVIEVGVDVPRASLMIIENAERMGLSQLHQLRGRVGRGSDESSCVLLYRAPLSALARRRLAVMRDTSDGFEIARHDLELRGPGELLGTRQTGLAQMRVADLARDADLLPLVQRTAARVELDAPRRDALIRRWIGAAARYGGV